MYRPDTNATESAASHGDIRRHRVVRVGAFASDPASCATFRGFDPDSGMITPAIADSLLYIDSEGHLRPSLATSWHRIDATTIFFIDLPHSDTVILLIDGDATQREIMKQHINHLPAVGPVVYVEAADAGQAHEVLGAVTPSLIILDLALPDATGSALLGDIRGRRDLASIPVLAASAMKRGHQMMPEAVAQERQQAMAWGASEFIPKPIHGEVFTGLVQDLIVTAPS